MITSKSNELVKYIKGLQLKKNRDESGEYIVEGLKMVREAVEEKHEVVTLILCEEIFKEQFNMPKNCKVESVSKNVFEYLSDTESPQGIMAIVKKKDIVNLENADVIFALDHVQDPGNLGTIMRTLDATGINTLLLSKGCADEYNPKVVRSTMGAIFRVNIQDNVDLASKLKELQKKGYLVIVTALDADSGLFEYSFPEKCVIVIGNESKGVSKEIQELANIRIKIPMIGKTESLNAGMAASLMAYEVLRKK